MLTSSFDSWRRTQGLGAWHLPVSVLPVAQTLTSPVSGMTNTAERRRAAGTARCDWTVELPQSLAGNEIQWCETTSRRWSTRLSRIVKSHMAGRKLTSPARFPVSPWLSPREAHPAQMFQRASRSLRYRSAYCPSSAAVNSSSGYPAAASAMRSSFVVIFSRSRPGPT